MQMFLYMMQVLCKMLKTGTQIVCRCPCFLLVDQRFPIVHLLLDVKPMPALAVIEMKLSAFLLVCTKC